MDENQTTDLASAMVPEEYKQAGMFMVIAGITNIMLGMLWGCMGLLTCVSSYGICFFCPFLGVVPLGLGIYEILEGNKMREGLWSPSARTANLIGLVMSLLSFHMIGVALEAFVLMNLNNEKVKAWIENPQ
jgi:tetrahydromethanopterin S-methyltransferase subunit C